MKMYAPKINRFRIILSVVNSLENMKLSINWARYLLLSPTDLL